MKMGRSVRKTWIIKADATNVIDLSYPLKPGMSLAQPTYGELIFDIHEMNGVKDVPEVDETGYPLEGFYSRVVRSHPNGIMEAYGTHVEASSHAFGARGRNIDEYPLSAFIGPGVVIDICDRTEGDPGYWVCVNEVSAWEKKHGKIPSGAIVVLNTGRHKDWGDYDRYFGVDKNGEYHYPGIRPEACELLVERRVSAVGTDAPTADGRPRIPVPNYPQDRRPHGLPREILMRPGNDILFIGYLANVDKLPEVGSLIICAPINFVRGSGGMARILAVLPE
jgi:kynurenine formamidase